MGRNFTPARTRGLRACAGPRGARYSNATCIPVVGGVTPSVYWQTADWLVAEGLANVESGRTIDDRRVVLTEAGHAALVQLGGVP